MGEVNREVRFLVYIKWNDSLDNGFDVHVSNRLLSAGSRREHDLGHPHIVRHRRGLVNVPRLIPFDGQARMQRS